MLNRVNPPRAVDFGYASAEGRDAGGFDPREAINFVWRQWRFISGVTALALLISALYIARQTPLYTASAELLLDPQREKITGQDPILTDVALDLPTIESQIAVIRSTSLLRRVVVKERLLNDPEFGAGPAIAGGSLLASIREFFSHSSPPSPTRRSNDTSADDDATEIAPDLMQTIQNLAGVVGVTRAGQALVLNVAITSADPPKAARLANAVADAYVVDKLEARFEAAKRASAWLSDRLVELGKQLRDSEEAVARFRADNNLVAAGAGRTRRSIRSSSANSMAAWSRRAPRRRKRRRDSIFSRTCESPGASSPICLTSPTSAPFPTCAGRRTTSSARRPTCLPATPTVIRRSSMCARNWRTFNARSPRRRLVSRPTSSMITTSLRPVS
jgi:uncharacterized protein involved in exopolysaccharide biosynthesis